MNLKRCFAEPLQTVYFRFWKVSLAVFVPDYELISIHIYMLKK